MIDSCGTVHWEGSLKFILCLASNFIENKCIAKESHTNLSKCLVIANINHCLIKGAGAQKIGLKSIYLYLENACNMR